MPRLNPLLAGVLAAALAASSAQAQTLLRDAEIEQWIKDYSYPIFKTAGIEPENVNILLIGDPTPNAFAGGLNMGIHTGLITTADRPGQVVGVIAHETGHIAGGHTQRGSEAFSKAATPILLSLILAAGAAAAGAPEAGIGLLGLGQNIALGEVLTYSRGQEAAADQAAVTYLEKTGQSGKGFLEFFAKLRNLQIIRGFQVKPYLQSHPLANDRIASLSERIEASPYYGKEDTPEEIARFKLIQGKIDGFLEQPHVALRKYPLTDQTPPARYARAVAYYRNADLDKGLAEIDRLIESEPENPYFHELKGQMYFESGRIAESVEPHARSVALAPDKALLKINLGRALIATDDLAEIRRAVVALKGALLLEPDNAFAWSELARAHGALGEEPLAELAIAEARYHVGARGEAVSFARRAAARLPKGSPDWRRAQDIILAATNGKGLGGGARDDDDTKPAPREEAPRDGEVPDPAVF